MRGLAILLAFNLVGLALQRLGLPLPGGVTGLILLAACLALGIVKLHWVEPTADLLLRHMLLFFTPVVVGVLAFTDLLTREWWPITAGLLGSWLVGLLVTGWVGARLTRADDGKAGRP